MRSVPEFECCYPECSARPSKVVDLPLCDHHMLRVFRTVRDKVDSADLVTRLMALNVPAKPPKRTVHPGVVYFIAFGDRIKIGFTTNIKKRMQAIPHDQILATVPGTLSTEKRMHKQFAHLRITGEWFSRGEDLMEYIAAHPYAPAA